MKVPYVNIPAQHKPIKDRLLRAISKVIDRGDYVFGEEVYTERQRATKIRLETKLEDG